MSLKLYQTKRTFSRSPEPKGKVRRAAAQDRRFVIQKHAARNLHYDFRLAMEGVLKSWAVPKGLPMKHAERRLAIAVEDHPLEYATFEGIIPTGNYGAGTVMVWDTGTYSVQGGDPRKRLAEGKLHLTLRGKKLRGEWTLVRLKKKDTDRQTPWLIFKSGSDLPALSRRLEDQSAVSKRSMAEIASDRDAAWESNQKTRPAAAIKTKARAIIQPQAAQVLDLRRSQPTFIEPMKARLAEELPKTKGWLFEIKFDGIRAIALKDGKTVRLFSRNRNPLNGYDDLVATLRKLPCEKAVLDGEIVALDEQGRSSFQLLQPCMRNSHNGEKRPPIVYYVFDLLNLEGHDLRGLPLLKRKELLDPLVAGHADQIRFSASFERHPEQLLKKVKQLGLEGLIGKQRDSVYQAGQRSGAWIKIKCLQEQEFVIGGYTAPKASRQYFGSLIIGYQAHNQFLYASKVGTGFSSQGLKTLYDQLQKLQTERCPFDNLPSPRGDLHGIGAGQMKQCTWVKPQLVCQVKFGEWTRDNHLRQPVFLGLRKDKPAKEVVRESAGQLG